MGAGDTTICKTRAKPGKPAEITGEEQRPGTGPEQGFTCIVLWPKKWIDAMRSGERVMQKPGAISRPGFLQQSQVALSYTSRVTKVKRNSWIVTPPATTL